MSGEFDIEALDLGAYLRRIGVPAAPAPGTSGLEALHFGHATRVPFENLDILLGRRIRLDMASLLAKLVRAERGGYCFEHNLLFAAALERSGFTVTRLAARVRTDTARLLPRTHMTLLVECDGRRWLCDVGFGADTPLHPVPFGEGEVRPQFGRSYRAVREGDAWVLQLSRQGTWTDLYAFTLEPQHLVDYEMANHFTSTWSESPFVQKLTAQLPRPQVRLALRGLELTENRGASVATRVLSGDDELLEVLASRFGLRFPPGTRFKTPDR
ncbi:MAG TPA: arylamine N-acetyltransferase [Thermoanaerobaculaceae bacterium]|nr:arylamine N-acetyltransferase [Thermoanaerobaculaceae bacterium]